MATQATYTVTSPPTPGLDPPPGVIPNFDQPYTLLPYVELTIALCIIVTTALVGARIYVKAQIVKKFLWEDWTCIVGWVGPHFQLFLFIIYPPRRRTPTFCDTSTIHAPGAAETAQLHRWAQRAAWSLDFYSRQRISVIKRVGD